MDGGLLYLNVVHQKLVWDFVAAATRVLLLEKSFEKVQPGESVQDLVTVLKDCPFVYYQTTAVKNQCLLIGETTKLATKLMARETAKNQAAVVRLAVCLLSFLFPSRILQKISESFGCCPLWMIQGQKLCYLQRPFPVLPLLLQLVRQRQVPCLLR